jgi:hypothetical protein
MGLPQFVDKVYYKKKLHKFCLFGISKGREPLRPSETNFLSFFCGLMQPTPAPFLLMAKRNGKKRPPEGRPPEIYG